MLIVWNTDVFHLLKMCKVDISLALRKIDNIIITSTICIDVHTSIHFFIFSYFVCWGNCLNFRFYTRTDVNSTYTRVQLFM